MAVEEPVGLATSLLGAVLETQHRLPLDTLQNLEGTVSTVLSLIRHGINSHAKIHTLPVEVLCMIFEHSLPSLDGDIRHSGCKDPRPSSHLRARTTLTSVCQKWRRIATDMASLWTVVDVPGPTTAEFVARSKELPLQVFASYSPDGAIGAALKPHAGRVRDLALHIPLALRSAIPGRAPPRAFAFAAPALEFLSITTCCRPFEESRPTLDFDAPVALFPGGDGGDGAPPRLRALVLSNTCWVPAVPAARLTHLRLEKGPPTPLLPLLAFLARCPALAHLAVVDVYLALAADVPPAGAHAVALPRLRTLTLGISQPMLSMRRLLPFFRLPDKGVRVRVEGPYALRALAGLHPFPELPFAHRLTRLALERAHGRLIVCASEDTAEEGEDGEREGCGLRFDLKEYRPAADEKQAVAVVREVVPLEGVREWAYRGPREWDGVVRALVQSVQAPCEMRRLVYVDAPARAGGGRAGTPTTPVVEAGARGPAFVARRVEGVREVEVWSGEARVLAEVGAEDVVRSLAKVRFHYSGRNAEEAKAAVRSVRERVPDVELCTGCGPGCEAARVEVKDDLEDPFVW